MVQISTQRFFLCAIALLALPVMTHAQTSNYDIVVDDTTVEPDETITISWELPSNQVSNTNWIGVFRTTDSNRSYRDWKYISGQSGTITLREPETGTYQARLFLNDSYQAVAQSRSFAVRESSSSPGNSADYTLTLSTDSIDRADTITIKWDVDPNQRQNRDWIGLYKVGDRAENYGEWFYVRNAEGNERIRVNEAGTYEFRYYSNDSYNLVASSEQFTVRNTGNNTGGNTGDVNINVSDTAISPGEALNVSWSISGGEYQERDWIGLYETNDDSRDYGEWFYVNQSSGSERITIDEAGTYEFRYFANDTFDLLATSDTITVRNDTNNTGNYDLEVSPQSTSAGSAVNVRWSAPSSQHQTDDWIAVYETGDSDRDYGDWFYVRTPNGDESLRITNPGTYEVRYFTNNSFNRVETSNIFTITGSSNGGGGNETGYEVSSDRSSYQLGDEADAIWDAPGGANILFDWIGLYRPNSSDEAYLDWEYVDVLNNEEQFDLDETGTFEFRYFKNNSYDRVAVSDTFTVTDGGQTGGSCSAYNLNQITNYPPPNGPIIAIGDSITAGVGATNGNDYVSELEAELNVNIINEGVPGDTTEDVLDRLNRDVINRDPSVVIVLVGGNDELRRIYESLRLTAAEEDLEDELDDYVTNELGLNWEDIPLISREETYANIRSIITDVQSTGAVTILVGFDNTFYNDSIEANYRDIAEDTGSLYVEDIYDDIFGRPSRMSDLIHPNDIGYEIIADRIGEPLACVI